MKTQKLFLQCLLTAASVVSGDTENQIIEKAQQRTGRDLFLYLAKNELGINTADASKFLGNRKTCTGSLIITKWKEGRELDPFKIDLEQETIAEFKKILSNALS